MEIGHHSVSAHHHVSKQGTELALETVKMQH